MDPSHEDGSDFDEEYLQSKRNKQNQEEDEYDRIIREE